MTALAPTLQAFFTDRLAQQLGASAHTIAVYRDAWRVLLAFTAPRTGIAATKLDITRPGRYQPRDRLLAFLEAL